MQSGYCGAVRAVLDFGVSSCVNSIYLTIGRSAEAVSALAGRGIAAAIDIQAPIRAGTIPLAAAAMFVGRMSWKNGDEGSRSAGPTR